MLGVWPRSRYVHKRWQRSVQQCQSQQIVPGLCPRRWQRLHQHLRQRILRAGQDDQPPGKVVQFRRGAHDQGSPPAAGTPGRKRRRALHKATHHDGAWEVDEGSQGNQDLPEVPLHPWVHGGVVGQAQGCWEGRRVVPEDTGDLPIETVDPATLVVAERVADSTANSTHKIKLYQKVAPRVGGPPRSGSFRSRAKCQRFQEALWSLRTVICGKWLPGSTVVLVWLFFTASFFFSSLFSRKLFTRHEK